MIRPRLSNTPSLSPKPRDFWSSHWMWMIPLGFILMVLSCAGLFAFNLKSSARRIRASEPYQHAVARALGNADAVKVLGAPVTTSKLAIGDLKVHGEAGEADFHFTLIGRWRSALVHVVATRSGGEWSYSEINFLPHGGGEQIDLTYEPPPAPSTAPRP
jgi:hypothetical protein